MLVAVENFRKFLRQITQENISIFVFVSVLFVVGIAVGALLVNSLSLEQKKDLFNYLSRFFGELESADYIATKEHLWFSFKENLKIFILIWILGISVIGVPIIWILLFARGIVVGFTVGFLVNQGGWKGFGIACATVLPHNFVFIPLLLFVTSSAIMISIKMIKRQFLKGNEPFKTYLQFYLVTLAFVLLFVFIGTAIEVYLSPLLMQLIV